MCSLLHAESLASASRVVLCCDKSDGRAEAFDEKQFEEKPKQRLAQNLGTMVGGDKVKSWL